MADGFPRLGWSVLHPRFPPVLAKCPPYVLDEALDRRVFMRLEPPSPDFVAVARRQDLTGGHIRNAMLASVAAAVSEHPEVAARVRDG